MNWQDKTTVKKGNIGEDIVNKHLIDSGVIPYSPDIGGSHPFDRLYIDRKDQLLFIADIKTKPKRTYYPDTGIDIGMYEEYKAIQDKYKIEVFLFFVDEDLGKIYGNYLRILDKPEIIIYKGKEITYPWNYKGIRYFPCKLMKSVKTLSQEEIDIISKHSTRNPDYVK